VAIRLFPGAQEAEAQTEQGMLRLFMLAQARDIRYLRRHLPGIDQLCLLYMGLGDRATLEEDLARRAARTAFLADGPIPRTRKEFDARCTAGRGRLLSIANEICELARAILGCYRELLARLDASPALPAEASADIRQQLDHLICPGFLLGTPDRWLREYPRYLEAIRLRLERLARAPLKDRQKAAILRPWWQDYLRFASHVNASAAPTELMEYRWLLEEFRVSLFAQELKTALPVSVERLKTLHARIEKREV
jgi:ATP-dependent helicase HrpA